LIKLSGINIKLVSAVVFNNLDFIILNKNEVVRIRKPGKEKGLVVNFGIIRVRRKVFGVGNVEIGVIFDVINVNVSGFDLAFLDLRVLGRGGSDYVFGNCGVLVGQIGDFVFFG